LVLCAWYFEYKRQVQSTKQKVLVESFSIKIHQFNRRRRGFETLVTQLYSGAIDCLIHILGCDNPKQQWHAGFHSCFADAPSHLASDVFKVRRLTADDHAEANHGIELS